MTTANEGRNWISSCENWTMLSECYGFTTGKVDLVSRKIESVKLLPILVKVHIFSTGYK